MPGVYAAGAVGYMTGRPGACLVVSGPGVVVSWWSSSSRTLLMMLLRVVGSAVAAMLAVGRVQASVICSGLAVGAAGNPVDHDAEGFEARVIQHEIDHLNGLLHQLGQRHGIPTPTHQTMLALVKLREFTAQSSQA